MKHAALMRALRKESGQTALDDLHVYIYFLEILGYVSLLERGKLMEEVVNGWKEHEVIYVQVRVETHNSLEQQHLVSKVYKLHTWKTASCRL